MSLETTTRPLETLALESVAPKATQVSPAAADNSVIVAADNVAFRIDQTYLVRDISLTVRRGQVLAIVGPNGAGKTTLLSLLAGDFPPSAGQVLWQNRRPMESVSLKELARHRGVVLQSHAVAFGFRVIEVVEMGRQPWQGTAAEDNDAAAIDRAMTSTEIGHLANRRYPTLSGGEKARVALARTLAQEPSLFLLDEPTAALDIRHQQRVLAQAQALAKAGAAVAVVVHDLSLAAAFADQVALLKSGCLVCLGQPDEVLTAERLSQVYHHPVAVMPHPETGRPLVLPRQVEVQL